MSNSARVLLAPSLTVNAGEESLAEVALATGYYDQPHLNAEFRELSGYSPREFLAALRYPESVSVAEAFS